MNEIFKGLIGVEIPVGAYWAGRDVVDHYPNSHAFSIILQTISPFYPLHWGGTQELRTAVFENNLVPSHSLFKGVMQSSLVWYQRPQWMGYNWAISCSGGMKKQHSWTDLQFISARYQAGALYMQGAVLIQTCCAEPDWGQWRLIFISRTPHKAKSCTTRPQCLLRQAS